MIKLQASLLEGLHSPAGIQQALQSAVQLEHSTIPPYLYALYSLKPGTNDTIGNLIRSVVFEEMAHMTLACNILNAIGGAPVIDEPGFIPAYPGPLPGGVDADLTVGLAPFSKDVVKNVFMEIEEPEFPLEFPTLASAEAPQVTIGMFYTALSDAMAIVDKRDPLFLHPSNPQVTGVFSRFGVTAVTDLASAQAAIATIIDQGEGTQQDPMDSVETDSEPAHYYRFAEIWHGRYLVATGAPPTAPVEDRYAYAGDKIPFDATAVQPARANPTETTLPVPPDVPNPQLACRTFNYTYTNLLKSLHTTFNGDPTAIDPAIGLMESLKEQAIALMAIPLGDGTNAGPSFEYTPVLAGPV